MRRSTERTFKLNMILFEGPTYRCYNKMLNSAVLENYCLYTMYIEDEIKEAELTSVHSALLTRSHTAFQKSSPWSLVTFGSFLQLRELDCLKLLWKFIKLRVVK